MNTAEASRLSVPMVTVMVLISAGTPFLFEYGVPGFLELLRAFLAYIVVPGTAKTIGDGLIPALYAGTWSGRALMEGGPE